MTHNVYMFGNIGDTVSDTISCISSTIDCFAIIFKNKSDTKILGSVRKYPCITSLESELLVKFANWKVSNGTFDQTIDNRDYDAQRVYSVLTLYIYEETTDSDVALKAVNAGTVHDAVCAVRESVNLFNIIMKDAFSFNIINRIDVVKPLEVLDNKIEETIRRVNALYGNWKVHDARYSSNGRVPTLTLYIRKDDAKTKTFTDDKTGTQIHEDICDRLHEMYEKKNSDYGDSFSKLYSEYGLTSVVIRLEDKLNRIRSIAKKGSTEVKDESVKDTLMDLANYAILALIELEKDS